ncbi:hypothetical protein NOVOSPHI9U_10451 [Novosphingobium sp. 9U]|nr:hypothetical protein NOVOSPHI9U_10451 [Novosphingobium sp. 9U]
MVIALLATYPRSHQPHRKGRIVAIARAAAAAQACFALADGIHAGVIHHHLAPRDAPHAIAPLHAIDVAAMRDPVAQWALIVSGDAVRGDRVVLGPGGIAMHLDQLVAGVMPGHRVLGEDLTAERQERLQVQPLVQLDHRIGVEAAAHQLLVAPIVGAAVTQVDVPDLGLGDHVFDALAHDLSPALSF